MKETKNIKNFHIISFIIVSILGTLLHFVYDWSSKNAIVGAFSAVNESTWEHLKLIFFPMLLTTIIGFFCIGKTNKNYICGRTKGVLAGMIFIITFFYTYTGILGKNIAIIDISSFFIGVLIAEYISYKIINNPNYRCNNILSSISLIILLFCFIIFTYNTPKIGIFKDPVTGMYGNIFHNINII